MPKESEMHLMNDRVNSLERTMIRSVEASENVAVSVNKLLHEFHERDIRHEYERIESAKLSEKVEGLNSTISDYIADQQPTLIRAKKSQDFHDGVTKSMSTTTGKLVIGLVILGIMVALGLDPRSLMVKP